MTPCTIYFLSLSFAICLAAADRNGISGVVQDSTGHPVSGAEVQIQSQSSGARWKLPSEEDGRYSLMAVPLGQYKITVRVPGFRTVSRVGVILDLHHELVVDFVMELLSIHTVVEVAGDKDQLDPSGGGSLILTHQGAGAALPGSGPDYRTLFDLVPGVVITPAGVNDGGQFTSNGQRPNANAFFVDGVSANTGVGGSTLPGSFPGASLPAMSADGTIENLSSSESTQTLELRTANFAPESGSRLGTEALAFTRSGSNTFHGELFGNIRDESWNARDWFANSYGVPYSRPAYEDSGVDVTGPIRHNLTYFFLSAEQSHLNDTGIELTTVPSAMARLNAPAGLQNILASFPLPVGPALGADQAQGLEGLARTATVATYSGRIDQTLGSWGTLFGRYVRSASSSSSSQVETTQGTSNWESVTLGLTTGRSGRPIQDVRLNYSRSDFRSTFNSAFGEPVFPLAGLFGSANSFVSPPGVPPSSLWGFSIPNLGQFVAGNDGSIRQNQWEFRDTISFELRRHQFRFGMDYLHQRPSRSYAFTSVLVETSSLQSLLEQDPVVITSSQLPQRGSPVEVGSLFAQDTFRITDALNVVFGIRWEATPPSATLAQVSSTSALWTGTEWIDARSNINGTTPWPMRYGQLEPRLGFAYRLPTTGLVLRAAAGLFYDPTLGASINPINGAPFNSWLLPGGAMIMSSPSPTGLQSPPSPLAPDVQQFLTGPYSALSLPKSYQWRVSLERTIRSHAIASVAYVGAANKHLLGNETYLDPATGIIDRSVTVTQFSSNYQALQLQFRGALHRNVYVSTSYTWSHCIDDGSEDSSVFLVSPGYSLNQARGSCDFDVRQTLTAAVSYHPQSRIPLLSMWSLSGILRSRTGFPVNVENNEGVLGQDADNASRPDIVSGVPIWLSDSSAAGGRRLNPNAFTLPSPGYQGTLGRNAIYGNGMAQLDISLRRVFECFRGTSLDVGINVFNVLNHPAFADPVPYLSSPLFGRSTSMQNLMLGSGTPSTGLPPLFQTGGSRSTELSLRFVF